MRDDGMNRDILMTEAAAYRGHKQIRTDGAIRNVSKFRNKYPKLSAMIDGANNKVKLSTIVDDYLLQPDTIEESEPEQECVKQLQQQNNVDLLVAEMFVWLAGSAKRRGKEFNLSLADVKRLVKRKKCQYTGATFTEEGPNRRSFDRLNPDVGYVVGNVFAVTFAANQIKNELFENPNGENRMSLTHAKKLLDVITTVRNK